MLFSQLRHVWCNSLFQIHMVIYIPWGWKSMNISIISFYDHLVYVSEFKLKFSYS